VGEGVKKLEELRRRALERRGKSGCGWKPAAGVNRPRRKKVERGNQPDKEDRQHRGPRAAIGAMPAGLCAAAMQQTLNSAGRGRLIDCMRGQELDHRSRVRTATLGARLRLRGDRYRKSGDRQPDPRVPVLCCCHARLPYHIVPQIRFAGSHLSANGSLRVATASVYSEHPRTQFCGLSLFHWSQR